MHRLGKEDVEHVATLARLNVDANEAEWYEAQLSDIMSEIDRIIDVSIDDVDIMISPSDNINCYSSDVEKDSLLVDDVLKNAKNTKDKYVTVPKVLHD